MTTSPRWKKILGWALPTLLAAALAFAYWRFFGKSGDALHFAYKGTDYELLTPRMLGVLLLAPYFLWFLTRSLADLPLAQRIASVVLRVSFVALLALGLSRLAKSSEESRVFTVFLVDVSDSMSKEAIADAHDDIERALATLPADAGARVITFAKHPRSIELQGDGKTLPALQRAPDKDGTASDLAAALKLAYGMFPSGFVRRAVLYSDGVQTEGDLLAEAARAKEFGVRLHTVASKRPVPPEVAVRELSIADKVRVGEPFFVRAQIFSSRPAKAKAVLKQGEAINGLDGVKSITLVPGDNEVNFQSVVRVPGEVTYSIELSEIVTNDDAPQVTWGANAPTPGQKADTFTENNAVATSVTVPGRPTVLYVEGNSSRASYFSSALTAQQFDVDVRQARELPESIRELERYDFVVVSDVPAEAVSLTQQEAIESYVRDLGGGFLFAGGEAGFGLGGWAHTTIERVLPVRMDSEKQRDEPQVAMALVIDRSGSMSGLPLEMAKAAARATADTLSGDDLLEVIAFDSQPTRIVRMTAAKHRARIQSDIARISPGGGTEIFSALDAAYQSLTAARAKRKHVILLTDGQAPSGGIHDLGQTMAGEGITISSVGLGSGVDEALLRGLSDVGGGRFYRVMDAQSLPRIFTRETELISKNAAVEEYFQPRVTGSADFLRGVDMASAPYLHGYVSTQMKPAPAQEILASDAGEPILARWRVGLGWAIAWTSDVKNLWAVEWLRWPGYGQFFGQMVREHMRSKKRQEFKLKAELDPTTGRVKTAVDAIGGDDLFQNGLDAKLIVKGPLPSSESQTLTMPQTAPGRYEADFPLPRYGSYVLHAVLSRDVFGDSAKGVAEGAPKKVQVAESFGHISSPYPREYRAFEPDRATLARAAAVTGGLADPPLEAYFDAAGEKVIYHKDLWGGFLLAAIPVYLLDLLLRRVRLGGGKQTARA